MANFIIYYEGVGDGCDYTIGCNLRLEFIEADSIEEAKTIVTGEIEESPDYAEEKIGSVIIYEIKDQLALDIKKIVYNIREQERKIQEAESERKEREEYERLRRKFEND